ncbi:hypothetical protein HPB52_006583 [Rhipicephalus sanguineus]|uniref:ABC transporter domain-containing protein n=1 Tax=Rhipicephalus sanguineus TaxID=34632 RepID=A0A9D4PI49_RHISA|nr:hypothetical protein HPB52_006583 [Rhipicephalus sanguineus]
MGHNVAAFLWRSLIVQAIRRHYIATALELLFVFVVFTGVLRREAPVPLDRNPNGTEMDSVLVSRRPTHVVFGPETSYNKRLLDAVVALYSVRDSTEEETVPSTPLNVSLVSDVAKVCAEIAVNQKEGSVHPMCAVLETPEGGKSHVPDVSLAYTIYRPFLEDDFGASGYSTSYMYAIEQAHLELQRISSLSTDKDDYEEWKVVVEDLPGWVFSKMNESYRSEFVITMFVVFTVTAMRRLNAIAYELSTGLAEKQALMGLTAVQFAAGHFFTALAFYLSESFIAITVMYTVDFSQDAAAYADGINPVMVTVSFLLFVVGQSIIPVFVTAVFPKVAPATVSPTAVTVPGYLTTTRRSKLFAGILPQSGLISVMIIMFLAQDYEGGAGWSVVTRRVMGNNVTILEIWLLMFTSDVGIVFLTWYLPQILPWCTDTPRNPLFLLTFIGTVPVLNGLDLNVYERKVTVLLGHNGAGKSTLMRILTGKSAHPSTLGGPTSGVAIVCGHDVYNDREMVHSQVALCEQSDLFFDDMSCGENALYFASLKDGHGTDVQKATASMLKKLGLEDEKDKMPSEVSCATLRMLSLAIAIASQPKVV